jgi:hypothetical protein
VARKIGASKSRTHVPKKKRRRSSSVKTIATGAWKVARKVSRFKKDIRKIHASEIGYFIY